ncbi:hypothetical protein V1509DRAFT_611956 [Lipomyces kononenkoae]
MSTTTTSPVSLSVPPFVFPLHHTPCPALALPTSAESKQQLQQRRSPSRTHAHRRSAAISHDFSAVDFKHHPVILSSSVPLLPSAPAPAPAPASPPQQTDENDRLPSPPASPCRSSSVSLASSSAASLASVSSASTSPPSKLKVMFSPAVEFIPSHSSTTSTSTTATITPISRSSSDLVDEPGLLPQDLPLPGDKRRSGRSWSFIRFRRRSAGDEDELDGDEDDDDDDEDDDDDNDDNVPVPPPRPATPPHASHSLATNHIFTRSATPPEPMIDLDAALGPAGTPPVLSGSWSAAGSVTAGVHRRTESAPEMLAWTGTKLVDFSTVSSSICGLDSSRGMKRKMSSVVEVEENAASDADESSASQAPAEKVLASPPDEPVEQRRRSVWDEFVNSFAAAAAAAEDDRAVADTSQSSPHVSPTDDVVVVDEFGDVVVIGEPGPEIRHELVATSDNANCTYSDVHSVSSTAGSETLSQKSEKKPWEHNRRRSLIVSLKSAMLKSQSVGNLLLHSDDQQKQDKLYRRRHSKLGPLPDASSEKFGSGHSNIVEPPRPATGSSSLSSHSGLPVPMDSNTQQSRKSKSMAYRVWDWVKGIVV